MKLWDTLRVGAHFARQYWRLKSTGAEDLSNAYFSRGLDTLTPLKRLSEPFRNHPTVYRAMVAFSRNIARLPFEVFRKGTDKQVDSHPVIRLLERPNPSMRGRQLQEVTSLHLEHYGEAMWWTGDAVRQGEGAVLPGVIRLLDPRRVMVEPDEMGDAQIYRVMTTKGQVPIPADRVIHFRFSSPYSTLRGVSWTDAAKSEYETDWLGQQWNKGLFARGAEPGGLFIPQEGFTWPDEEVERLLTTWEERHQGFTKSHRTGFIPRGLEFQRTTMGQREMEFSTLRRTSRENTLSAAGLPPAIAGILEFANYANMQPQLRIFFELELIPRLVYMESVMQADLLDRYNTGLEGHFKTEAINALLEDLSAKTDVAGKLWAMGVTLKELNDRLELGLDLKDSPAADKSFLPFSAVLADSLLDKPGGDGTQPADGQPATPPQGDQLPAPAPGGDGEPPDGQPPAGENLSVRMARLVGDLRGALRGGRLAVPVNGKRLHTEEARAMVWRALINSTRDLESKAQVRYRDHVRTLRNEVLRNLKAAGQKSGTGARTKQGEPASAEPLVLTGTDIEAILFDLKSANEELVLSFEPVYRATVQRGFDTVQQQTGITVPFDFLDPDVTRILTQRRQTIVQTNKRMREELRSVIVEGVDGGESELDIADRVLDYFDGQRRNARTIARTEVHSAFSAGRFEAMGDAGIEKHEWLSARDFNVRDDHRDEDGGPAVPIGERFPVTGLLYPLEEGGPAEQVINCRCVTLPVVG